MASPVDLDRPLPAPYSESASERPVPPRVQRAIAAFEEAVGGRDALVAELAHATLEERETTCLQLLADPRNDKLQLHEVLGYAHLSVARFLRLFRDAKGARAYLDALDKVWTRLPDVAEDVMSRALPRSTRCHPCQGTGYQRLTTGFKGRNKKKGPVRGQMERVVCPECHGEGRKPVEPTLDYQALALRLGGLPKTVPAVQVDQSRTQINAQQNVYGSDAMRDFISAVQRVRYGPAPAHPTSAEEEPPEEGA